MAIVECKVCGKEMSDLAEICLNCGYEPPAPEKSNTYQPNVGDVDLNGKKQNDPRKKSKGKSKLIVGVIITLVLVGLVAVGGMYLYGYYVKANDVTGAIDTLLKTQDGEISMEDIHKAETMYDELPIISKLFVKNLEDLEEAKSKLSQKPVDLTTDNIREYLDFEVTVSDYTSGLNTFLETPTYEGRATVTIMARSLQGVTFDEVEITVEPQIMSSNSSDCWSDLSQTITIPPDGSASVSAHVSYFSPDTPAVEPSFPVADMKITKVSGIARRP